MFKPRNTLVVVRLIAKSERKVGKINVPTNNDCYTEAEVIAVGPGNVQADGGRSETFDLKPGQRVWVKHKKKMSNGSLTKTDDEGLPYHDEETDISYVIFEQSSVVAILSQPESDGAILASSYVGVNANSVNVGPGSVIGTDYSTGKSTSVISRLSIGDGPGAYRGEHNPVDQFQRPWDASKSAHKD